MSRVADLIDRIYAAKPVTEEQHKREYLREQGIFTDVHRAMTKAPHSKDARRIRNRAASRARAKNRRIAA